MLLPNLNYIYTWQWPSRKLIGYFGHCTRLNIVFLYLIVGIFFLFLHSCKVCLLTFLKKQCKTIKTWNLNLRWFLSIPLRIPTTHNFASSARVNERVHVHNEKIFLQAKLDSEINACFLFNEHADLYFFIAQ